MGCPCHRITSTIVCNNCGTQTTISHKERLSIQDAVRRNGRKCKKCYSSDFSLVESSDDN